MNDNLSSRRFRPLDTLAMSKRLVAAGMDRALAEEQAVIWDEIVESDLANKRDFAELEARLNHKIAELESNLKRDITELEANLKRDVAELEARFKRDLELGLSKTKHEIVRWLIGFFLGQTGLMVSGARSARRPPLKGTGCVRKLLISLAFFLERKKIDKLVRKFQSAKTFKKTAPPDRLTATAECRR